MAEKMRQSVSGIYMSPRDGGLIYTYEGSWSLTAGNLDWEVRVMRDGELKGIAEGSIVMKRADIAPERVVRVLVQDAIERQRGIDR